MLRCFLFLLSIGLCAPALFAQPLAEFTVAAGAYDRLNTPVSVSWNALSLLKLSPDSLQLVEYRDGDTILVAVQWEGGAIGAFSWVLNGETPARTTRRYALRRAEPAPRATPAVVTHDQQASVAFAIEEQEVLTYQHGRASVPDGVDEIYRRGGFIHPLRSPAGAVLTRIQPPDHYHHYGVWNPWTHTEFEGREIDFWNLAKGQGTVKARGVTTTTSGAVFGGLTAWHEHIAYADSADTTTGRKLLNENWDLRVWNSDPQQKSYLVDFATTQRNVTEQPFVVKEYRYQGFGFRANAAWNDRTAHLLTSAGKNKADGNGTRARWIDVRGPTDQGEAGLLFMTHPTNFNFPELLRIWPEGANEGVENVFVNFNPTQDRDWVLQPGRNHTLRYRMLVYDGKIDSVTAQRYWQDYAYPPQVRVRRVANLSGKRLLLYTKNGEGYVHDNIPASIAAIEKLASENGFTVVPSENPGMFTADTLKLFDAIIFSNTNNDIFDTPAQHDAFQNYIRAGGRMVGIHSACGSERDWPWFARVLGGRFVRHPKLQDFEVKVLNAEHPSTNFLPPTWHIKQDECYYMDRLNPDIHVLLAADLSTVEDEKKKEYPGDTFGDRFPTSWCHATDGGRQWYTSLGHRSEHYSDPMLMRHILGGIVWVLGDD